MNTKPEQAVNNFREGSNCSQAVISVYAEQLGLSRKTALKIAQGFGGGMGRMTKTCGAVTGAFMVLGLKYGNADIHDKEAKENGLFTSVCPKLVSDAAEILDEMINQ